MKPPRFILSRPSALSSGSIVIQGNDLHHLKNVLRLTEGGEVEIAAASLNQTFRCRIESLNETEAKLNILETAPAPALNHRIHLILGQPKGSVADAVVEKCVELGVSSVLFFAAERSQGRDFAKRAERLSRISESAAKQSGAPVLKIECFPSLASVLASLNFAAKAARIVLTAPAESGQNVPNLLEILTGGKEEPVSLPNLQNSTESADSFLIIGPEGGLTPGEYEIAARFEFKAASLGAFTLRVETAAVVACGCVLLSRGSSAR